jgi:dimethylhistidine N-methyltransferase
MPLALPALPSTGRRLAFFPGSTIGNFSPWDAAAFLRGVRHAIGPDGALVLGVDRVKSARVLHAAYNDSLGVTAAFNRNVLARINRELGADFHLERFQHRAFFNEVASRIEMHLVSTAAQTVTVAGARIRFEAGETIWTESSYKYDRASLDALANASGFAITRLWSDAACRFWVAFLRVRGSPHAASRDRPQP